MKKSNICVLLATMILFIGCAPQSAEKDASLLPDSKINHLKAYGRFVVNANSVGNWEKTNIEVDKGDMLLIFAESKNTKSLLMRTNLLLTVGDSIPQYAAVNRLLEGGLENSCYGYFMSPGSGKLEFGVRRKAEGEYDVDIIVVSESGERYLPQIFKEMININPDDELFRIQTSNFIDKNKWIFYAQVDVISSPSNANVYIDDEFKGNTPLKIKNLIKNVSHNICIKLDNYSEFCDTFLPKNKSRFNVTLKELQNNLPSSLSAPPARI